MVELRPGLISCDELSTRLGEPRLRLLDASYYLPAAKRDPKAEFNARAIKAAQFFDIDEISDRTSSLPHMLPTAEHFATAVGALGVGNEDEVVVYDTTPMFGACRAWWMFRVFGHENVRVLDGGLPLWLSRNLPAVASRQAPTPARFSARLNRELVKSVDEMRARIDLGAQIADARSAARFEGSAPEPRPGLRLGHMPGAKNVPFNDMLDPGTGTMLPSEALRRRLTAAGLDLGTGITASCGSGVTACVVALALHTLGIDKVSVYDGSWAEWGSLPDTPIVAPGSTPT